MTIRGEGLASIDLGSTREVGLRLVSQGRFENLSEACRAGIRRLEQDAMVVDQLVRLGDQGLASGIDTGFDLDQLITETRSPA